METPTQDEIYAVLDECAENEQLKGCTLYSGMTYEQGVQDAICWLTEGEDRPMSMDEEENT